MGDSLSDRGILALNDLLALASGLTGNSPLGRFANGRGWVDLVAAFSIAELTIEEMKAAKAKLIAQLQTESDEEFIRIKNAILSIDDNDLPNFFKKFRAAYNLDNPYEVLYEGQRDIRTYAIGGATAADWEFEWSELFTELPQDAARPLLSNLDKQRAELFADDLKYNVTAEEKATTLVTEWTGANDLITVNDSPTNAIADSAVDARINNIEQLIAAGYQNFVLVNLPDFSLTPRFQTSGNPAEIENAHDVTLYFNAQLAAKVEQLKAKYPGCYFDVFDVNAIFTDAYNNPEDYGFNSDLRTQYFTESEELKEDKGNAEYQAKKITPDTGKDDTGKNDHYMFWNNVHPSAHVQAILAAEYSKKYDKVFDFQSPNKKTPSFEERTQQKFLEFKKRLNRVSDQNFSDQKIWSMFVENQKLEEAKNNMEAAKALLSPVERAVAVPLPADVLACIEAVQNHADKLSRQLFNKSVAGPKAAMLNALLEEFKDIDESDLRPREKLAEILKKLNEVQNNVIINMPQNPKLDTFFKEKEYKKTSYELLNKLNETIATSLQDSSYRIKLVTTKIEEHADKLRQSDSKLAQLKVTVLANLVIELKESEGDLTTVHSILEKYNSGKNFEILATHQNRNWDKFINKETTHSQDLLSELAEAVYDAGNVREEPDQEGPQVARP